MATQVRINRPISDALYNWISSRAVVLAVDRQPTFTIITLKGTPTQQDFDNMVQIIRDRQNQAVYPVAPDVEAV